MSDPHTDMKNIRLNCLLNIMDRELDDFSQTWDSCPETVPQRFADLITLTRSAKNLSSNASD